jgi:hypothetical protein
MIPICFIPEKVSPGLMGRVTLKFSYINFWVENIFMVIVFFIYELCLLPFSYLLTFYNLVVTSHGTYKLILNWFRWAIFGLLYLNFIIAKDIFYLFRILSMYRGCKAADPHYNIDDDDDEGLSDDQKILVYNEIRIIVMQMYVEVTE